jgi:hypothetical protein
LRVARGSGVVVARSSIHPVVSYNSYNTPLLSIRHITDPRFVQLPMPDYRANWKRGARGFHAYWVEAEAIVAERCANIA